MSNLKYDDFLRARSLIDTGGWAGPEIVESMHIPQFRKAWKMRQRQPPKSWWRRLLFWPPFVSFWQATLVEFCEQDEPHFYVDTINNRIICHPANATMLRELLHKQMAEDNLRYKPRLDFGLGRFNRWPG